MFKQNIINSLINKCSDLNDIYILNNGIYENFPHVFFEQEVSKYINYCLKDNRDEIFMHIHKSIEKYFNNTNILLSSELVEGSNNQHNDIKEYICEVICESLFDNLHSIGCSENDYESKVLEIVGYFDYLSIKHFEVYSLGDNITLDIKHNRFLKYINKGYEYKNYYELLIKKGIITEQQTAEYNEIIISFNTTDSNECIYKITSQFPYLYDIYYENPVSYFSCSYYFYKNVREYIKKLTNENNFEQIKNIFCFFEIQCFDENIDFKSKYKMKEIFILEIWNPIRYENFLNEKQMLKYLPKKFIDILY